MKQRCEAVIHSEKCNGNAQDVDHFTPRAIARLFNLGNSNGANGINGSNNLIHMHRTCHVLKDRSTSPRVKLLRKQLTGETVTLNDYRKFRNRFDVRFVEDQ